MNTPANVTACIVARDAAALLPACIASVSRAVDEVLLVDNGSRDDTRAVARAEGARIVEASAVSHEHARNAYVEAARTPWILVIDADERLASPLPELPSERDRSPGSPRIDGYALERHDFIGDGRWASTRLVRLFRRAPHIRYFDSIAHAAVAPAIARAGGRIVFADTVLHHLDGVDLTRDHHAKRANMRARLERQLGDRASPAILRVFYALELFAIDDESGAATELTRALERDGKLEPIVALSRAQQHRMRGRWDEAERLARHCLSLRSDVFRGRDAAHAVLADALDRQGRHDEALAAVTAARAESPRILSHLANERTLRGEPARAGDDAPAPPDLAKGPGARPSIFVQQDALLTRYRPT